MYSLLLFIFSSFTVFCVSHTPYCNYRNNKGNFALVVRNGVNIVKTLVTLRHTTVCYYSNKQSLDRHVDNVAVQLFCTAADLI